MLAAESLSVKSLSKLYFDTNLIKRNLVPLYVVVANHSQQAISLRVARMRLLADHLNDPAIPVPFDEVSERMSRKSLGPAIAWGALGLVTLIFAIIFVPMGSALAIAQTASVNERLKQDVWVKSFKDSDLPDGQETRGVVFFDVDNTRGHLSNPRLLCPISIQGQPQERSIEVPLS